MTNDQAALIAAATWLATDADTSSDITEAAETFANWLDERERERSWKQPGTR